MSTFTRSSRNAPAIACSNRPTPSAYDWNHVSVASNSAAASPNRRSGTNGTHATSAVSLPSRDDTSTTEPWSGGATFGTACTSMARSSFAMACSRIALSWFPGMATTGMPASCSRTSASNTSASASGDVARCS